MVSTVGYLILGFFIGFMLRRIKDHWPNVSCAFGWHKFRWKHYSGEPLQLQVIPSYARCEHCNTRYHSE